MHILRFYQGLTTVVLLFTSVYFSHSAPARDLNEPEVKEIKGLGEQLLRKFNSPQTVFVGLGQSPSLLIAYLETQVGRERAIVMPISSARGLPVLKTLFPLDKEMGPFMANYLRQFIPLGNLGYVFIDFTKDGDAFSAQRELVEAGLRQLAANAHSQTMVAMIGPTGRQNGAQKHADWTLNISSHLEEAFLKREFRDIHPFTKRHLFDVMREYFALNDEASRACHMRVLADEWPSHDCAARRAKLLQKLSEPKSCRRWFELWRF